MFEVAPAGLMRGDVSFSRILEANTAGIGLDTESAVASDGPVGEGINLVAPDHHAQTRGLGAGLMQ
ncbi:hypothetical protein [Parapedomonas caeni]